MSTTIHDGQDAAQGQHRGSNSGDATNKHPESSKNRPSGPKSHSASHLENLPAELKTLILLNVPDLQTLRELVHASPIIHAQYRHDRDKIIPTILSRELDGFFIDAYATVMSRVRELKTRTDNIIFGYLRDYQMWLSSCDPFPLNINSITPGRMRWLVSFHINVAQPLACLYGN